MSTDDFDAKLQSRTLVRNLIGAYLEENPDATNDWLREKVIYQLAELYVAQIQKRVRESGINATPGLILASTFDSDLIN